MLFNPSPFIAPLVANAMVGHPVGQILDPAHDNKKYLVLLACKMYSGDMLSAALTTTLGVHKVLSAASPADLVYIFLRKLPVCPQIRPLFYPQIAGGSTDLSTNCHFCPQACPHFCPQIIMSVRTLVRSVVRKEPLLSADLSANYNFCPQTCPQLCSFVRKLFSSGCKVESRFVRARPPVSEDLFA